MEFKFVVYENRPTKKATVHKANCGHANECHTQLKDKWLRDNPTLNGRWYGYFANLNEAVAFASLLPNRQMKYCGHCLRQEKLNV